MGIGTSSTTTLSDDNAAVAFSAHPIAVRYLVSKGVSLSECERYAKLVKGLSDSDDEATIYLGGQVIELGSFTLAVSHLLNGSDRPGHSIEKVNGLLAPVWESAGLNPLIAIALAEGDDPVCLDLESGQVFLWLLDGNEKVHISDSLNEFATIIGVEGSSAVLA